MRRDVVADITCIWQTAFPKIIAIAQEEGIENHYISSMMTDLPMSMPDGMYSSLGDMFVCIIVLKNPEHFKCLLP